MENEIFDKYLLEHNKRISEFGLTPKALWGSEQSQNVRFKILTELFLTKSNFSVLDLGCGLGDFYKFLLNQGFEKIHYTGIDINNELIEEAQKRYSEENFILGSVNELPVIEKFDYVIASGIYNLGDNVSAVESFFVDQFKTLYENINIGFGVNFLSIYSSNPDSVSIYHNPTNIVSLCINNFSKYVQLHQHYLPHDFTIFVYKNQINLNGKSI